MNLTGCDFFNDSQTYCCAQPPCVSGYVVGKDDGSHRRLSGSRLSHKQHLEKTIREFRNKTKRIFFRKISRAKVDLCRFTFFFMIEVVISVFVYTLRTRYDDFR